ncbi:MAG TPA: DUF4911 domain-containing protein [Aquificaceae bacterium]|nr:DUF4911 domain-containing protein [Aquificaceae bacterium]HIQ48723.1 DUF4911 domain-containing protein [Aquifex aeolicus]
MQKYSKYEIKAKVIKVRMSVEEVGLFNSLIDGLPRYALTRTKEKGTGEVFVLVTPYKVKEVMEALEGMKKHIKSLEILGETDEELTF